MSSTHPIGNMIAWTLCAIGVLALLAIAGQTPDLSDSDASVYGGARSISFKEPTGE